MAYLYGAEVDPERLHVVEVDDVVELQIRTQGQTGFERIRRQQSLLCNCVTNSSETFAVALTASEILAY